MIIAFGLSVIGALVGLSAPLITSHVIDEVIPAHNMKGLSIWSMILVLTILVNLVFIAIRSKIMTRVGQSIVYDIRSIYLNTSNIYHSLTMTIVRMGKF